MTMEYLFIVPLCVVAFLVAYALFALVCDLIDGWFDGLVDTFRR
jgi:hypothetical protein